MTKMLAISVVIAIAVSALLFLAVRKLMSMKKEIQSLKKDIGDMENDYNQKTKIKESIDTGDDTSDVVNILNLVSKHNNKQ